MSEFVLTWLGDYWASVLIPFVLAVIVDLITVISYQAGVEGFVKSIAGRHPAHITSK